jgi:hypothetical protein
VRGPGIGVSWYWGQVLGSGTISDPRIRSAFPIPTSPATLRTSVRRCAVSGLHTLDSSLPSPTNSLSSMRALCHSAILSAMEKPKLIIEGKVYTFVKNRNHVPVSIYKSSTEYLRIGPKELLLKEIDYQKTLLGFGFPVPEIIKEGAYEDQYYFIEPSLGERHFSQIFKANLSDVNTVSNTDFAVFLALIKKYAEAQLKTVTASKFIPSEVEGMIKYDVVVNELPNLEKMTTEAMRKAEGRIATLPIALTHGDFNPHNILEAGVIDWERASYAPLGYDLATNISQIFFFPLRGEYEYIGGYTYSREQIDQYWKEMDALYTANGFPKVSEYATDFIFCRTIWSVVRMDRWPNIQRWRYRQYEEVLTEYLNTGNLTELLFSYQS